MTGRTIAIGDIHGCAAALDTLLQQLQLQATDTLVTLGDYVDRGPDSRGVVDRLLAIDQECQFVPLLGNHEAMLLGSLRDEAQLAFWKQCGGIETLTSYGWTPENEPTAASENDLPNPRDPFADTNVIPEKHLSFFRSCTLAYETESHVFLHANYDAKRPVDEQDEFSLLWKHLSRGIPEPHLSGKTVIVGHTPQISGDVLDLGHIICIDTYCFGDGWLTAMDVATKEVWQANKDGALRT